MIRKIDDVIYGQLSSHFVCRRDVWEKNKCLMQIMNWKSQKVAKNWEKYVKWSWKYREKNIGIELSMSFLLTFYVWKRGG